MTYAENGGSGIRRRNQSAGDHGCIGNGRDHQCRDCRVISNNRTAYALERAKQNGIDAAVVSPKDYENREAFNQALLEKVESYSRI